MGRVEGKVALITGAARGQGRSHAVRLAEEGADIVGIDLPGAVSTVPYPLATEDDMAETVALVEKEGRRMVALHADVRDADAMTAAVERGVDELGRLDIVLANAGIASFSPGSQMSQAMWRDVIDINLNGVWNTVRPTLPILIDAGRGGAIVLTSSSAGLKGMANIPHYSAAKHALVGLGRSLAIELGPHRIRVNTVHPTSVNTDMILNDATRRVFAPDADVLDDGALAAASLVTHLLPVPWVEAIDVSNAVLWLVSDEARYVTGVALPVDAGSTVK
jgi:(+)-trans-carveol dehydrogenase